MAFDGESSFGMPPPANISVTLTFEPINQSRCRTRVTSVGDSINESLICRPVLLTLKT